MDADARRRAEVEKDVRSLLGYCDFRYASNFESRLRDLMLKREADAVAQAVAERDAENTQLRAHFADRVEEDYRLRVAERAQQAEEIERLKLLLRRIDCLLTCEEPSAVGRAVDLINEALSE